MFDLKETALRRDGGMKRPNCLLSMRWDKSSENLEKQDRWTDVGREDPGKAYI